MIKEYPVDMESQHEMLLSHTKRSGRTHSFSGTSTQILEELNLKEGPTLGRKRTTYSTDGSVLEISFFQYNTRMHKYVIRFDV